MRSRGRGEIASRRIVSGGVGIHTWTAGEGDAVVLVHGFGVSGRYMLPLAEALELATAGFGRLISLAKEMAFAVEGIILVMHAEDARCWRNARCAGSPGRKWKRCRGARL